MCPVSQLEESGADLSICGRQIIKQHDQLSVFVFLRVCVAAKEPDLYRIADAV